MEAVSSPNPWRVEAATSVTVTYVSSAYPLLTTVSRLGSEISSEVLSSSWRLWVRVRTKQENRKGKTVETWEGARGQCEGK